MNETTKKYLLCAGVLAGLGVLSATVLAGVNMLTAPVIEANEKAATAAAYKVFNEKLGADSESEEITVFPEEMDATGIEFYVEAKKGDAVVGRIFSVSGTNQYGAIKALIAFDNDGKLVYTSLLENGQTRDGFKTYIDGINADPTSVGQLEGFGATYGTNTFYALYAKAQAIAVKLGGGVAIDPAAIAAAIYGNSDNIETVAKTVTDAAVELSYYSRYTDDSKAEEAARIYLGSYKENDQKIVAAVALSGANSFDGAYIVSYSDESVTTHATGTTFAATELEDFKADALAAKVYDSASAAIAKSPLLTLASKAMALYPNATSVSEVVNINKTTDTRPEVDAGTSLIISSWNVLNKDSEVIGTVYRAKTELKKEPDESNNDYRQVHGYIDWMIGFFGESNDNPSLTKIYTIKNTFTMGDALNANFIEKWNQSEVKDFNTFKAMSNDEVKVSESGSIGATYSTHGMVDTLKEELTLYVSIKEAN